MYVYMYIATERGRERERETESESTHGAMVHHLGLRVSHARPVEIIVARFVLSSGACSCPNGEQVNCALIRVLIECKSDSNKPGQNIIKTDKQTRSKHNKD